MSKVKLVVIGNGMVGHHFLEQVAASSRAQEFEVTVVGEERHSAYDRVHLSEYFQGKAPPPLLWARLEQYEAWGFKVKLGVKATQIHRDTQQVSLADGSSLSYDWLVLATGSFLCSSC